MIQEEFIFPYLDLNDLYSGYIIFPKDECITYSSVSQDIIINNYPCKLNGSIEIQFPNDFKIESKKINGHLKIDCVKGFLEPYIVNVHQYIIYENGYTHDIGCFGDIIENSYSSYLTTEYFDNQEDNLIHNMYKKVIHIELNMILFNKLDIN